MTHHAPAWQPAEEIPHFPLPGLLPVGYTLALNIPLGTLSLLSPGDDGPRLWVEQRFTNSETCILIPLLQEYPHYCPYEVLLAHFNSRNVTDKDIDRERKRLQKAQEIDGQWEVEMRPVRNILSRTRLKIHAFNIEITSILEVGYILRYRKTKGQTHE